MEYILATFITIGIGEALHHFPVLELLNAYGFEHLKLQLGLFGIGVLCYVLITLLFSRQAYAKWVSGATIPDIEKCSHLAKMYGVTRYTVDMFPKT